jgi:flagellum-specific peptidoglycan hydrolase FlgJ
MEIYLKSNTPTSLKKKLGNENYTDWAVGLSKAGYATDKKYAQKLIHLIEDLDLFQYD